MIKEKEIVITIPESLLDVNLAAAMLFDKAVKVKGISELEKSVQIISALNEIDVSVVRSLSMDEIGEIGGKIIKLFVDNDEDVDVRDYYVISINDKEYGLEPNFDKIETGAYIDLTELLNDVENNLHKIMAVLYRPIASRKGSKYILTKYSTEDDDIRESREDEFLKSMPYLVVRAVVNFILSHIES